MDDGITYGFSKPDAQDLLNGLGMRDVEFEELKPPARAANNNAIIDIRISGNLLQYTKDGTNWTTWHTATECPP